MKRTRKQCCPCYVVNRHFRNTLRERAISLNVCDTAKRIDYNDTWKCSREFGTLGDD